MTAPRAINVSPSVLADVLSCDTKAWTRHVQGYTSVGESIKAIAGQAMHAGVAAYLGSLASNTPANTALAAFHAIYDPAWSRLAAEQLEPSLVPENLHRILARFMETHPASQLPWRKVLSVEEAFTSREFRVPVGPRGPFNAPPSDFVTVKLIVRPDAIIEDHDGLVRWVDTKTTGWRITDTGWRRSLRLSLQLQLYTDAVMTRYPGRAALGGWINAMELRQLPSDPKRICKTFNGGPGHNVPYAECGGEHAKQDFVECMTTTERVERAVLDAYDGASLFVRLMSGRESTDPAQSIDLETFVAALRMNGAAKDGCRFCSAADWCEASRKPAALSSFMHYEPWVVEEGTR